MYVLATHNPSESIVVLVVFVVVLPLFLKACFTYHCSLITLIFFFSRKLFLSISDLNVLLLARSELTSTTFFILFKTFLVSLTKKVFLLNILTIAIRFLLFYLHKIIRLFSELEEKNNQLSYKLKNCQFKKKDLKQISMDLQKVGFIFHLC